jgi:hypothetical protein
MSDYNILKLKSSIHIEFSFHKTINQKEVDPVADPGEIEGESQ